MNELVSYGQKPCQTETFTVSDAVPMQALVQNGKVKRQLE